jgi:hypothetical protein
VPIETCRGARHIVDGVQQHFGAQRLAQRVRACE